MGGGGGVLFIPILSFEPDFIIPEHLKNQDGRQIVLDKTEPQGRQIALAKSEPQVAMSCHVRDGLGGRIQTIFTKSEVQFVHRKFS